MIRDLFQSPKQHVEELPVEVEEHAASWRPIEHAECGPLEYSVWNAGSEWAAYVCVRITPREVHTLMQPTFRWHADGAGRIDAHNEGEQETTFELRADTRESLLGGIRPIWRECYRRALGGGAT